MEPATCRVRECYPITDAHRTTFSDQWDGYAANRDRMLGAMAQRSVANPIVLSGDVHSFWANALNRADGTPVSSEMVTSALAASLPPAGRSGDVAANNPHISFHDTDQAG